jgi:hypothetical protein
MKLIIILEALLDLIILLIFAKYINEIQDLCLWIVSNGIPSVVMETWNTLGIM